MTRLKTCFMSLSGKLNGADMTKISRLLAAVAANPGQSAKAYSIDLDFATDGALRQAWLAGQVDRASIGPIRYWPAGTALKVEPVITPGVPFFTSRGFPGVDIDAIHYKRGREPKGD